MPDLIALATESSGVTTTIPHLTGQTIQLRSLEVLLCAGPYLPREGGFNGPPQDVRCTQSGGMGWVPGYQADATPTQRFRIPPWKIS